VGLSPTTALEDGPSAPTSLHPFKRDVIPPPIREPARYTGGNPVRTAPPPIFGRRGSRLIHSGRSGTSAIIAEGNNLRASSRFFRFPRWFRQKPPPGTPQGRRSRGPSNPSTGGFSGRLAAPSKTAGKLEQDWSGRKRVRPGQRVFYGALMGAPGARGRKSAGSADGTEGPGPPPCDHWAAGVEEFMRTGPGRLKN